PDVLGPIAKQHPKCDAIHASLLIFQWRRAVLAVATDIRAQHQRTFSLHCFVFGGFPSRFVNRKFSYIVTSTFAPACFRGVTLETATAPPKRQAIHSEMLSPPPRVLYRPAPVRHAKGARP